MSELIPVYPKETYIATLSTLDAESLIGVFRGIEAANQELHEWRLTLERGAEIDKAESEEPVVDNPFLISAGFAAGYHALTGLGLHIPSVPGTYLGDSVRFPEADFARGEDVVWIHFMESSGTEGYRDAAIEWGDRLAVNDDEVLYMFNGFAELYIAAERLVRDNSRVNN